MWWDLYDALIEGIPVDYTVEDLFCGSVEAMVQSRDGIGLGRMAELSTRLPSFPHRQVGMKLRDLAALVKSWNYPEASLGLAAINAYYNTPSTAMRNGVDLSAVRFMEDRMNDPFIAYQQAVKNEKVAVIGHFHLLEELFAPVCELYIMEDDPLAEDGDYPCNAAEYILPQCGYVFISCGAVTDKSLPRFLALAPDAYIVLVGPATPMAPVLFDFGINDLSGFIVKDTGLAKKICTGMEQSRIYATGQKVSLKKADFSARQQTF